MKEPIKYTIHHYWFADNKYYQCSDGGYKSMKEALRGVEDYLRQGHGVDYISDSRMQDKWIIENGEIRK